MGGRHEPDPSSALGSHPSDSDSCRLTLTIGVPQWTGAGSTTGYRGMVVRQDTSLTSENNTISRVAVGTTAGEERVFHIGSELSWVYYIIPNLTVFFVVIKPSAWFSRKTNCILVRLLLQYNDSFCDDRSDRRTNKSCTFPA